MNLYLLTQNEVGGYDTYDSCVVAAETEEEAKKIHPSDYVRNNAYDWGKDGTWASSPESVSADLIGIAAEGTETGVILASFNAG